MVSNWWPIPCGWTTPHERTLCMGRVEEYVIEFESDHVQTAHPVQSRHPAGRGLARSRCPAQNGAMILITPQMARERGLSRVERFHQQHSKPLMNDLHQRLG